MGKLTIRKLIIEELPLLFKLHEYNDEEDMLKQNTLKLRSGDIAIFGLFLDGEIIGELRTKYRSEDEREAKLKKRAYLYAFRILEKYQGIGYGKYLLQQVIGLLDKEGYLELTVGVEDENEKAIYMYKQVGFNRIIARKREEYQGDAYEYNLYLKINRVGEIDE